MGERSRGQAPRLSGILNVDKPAGPTSHDVVSAIRRASKERRVGHAGTLDPMATGVLLICVGHATRLAEYLMEGRKRYEADIRLGIATDTYDATGAVLSEADASAVTLADVERAIPAFLGRVEQVPPMYSAIKRGGTALHRLARRGVEVEREARVVHVYDWAILGWTPPLLRVAITCSKGTYIRSLAHDLGQALGCGAHLARLARTAIGDWRLEDATPLAELVAAFAEGRGERYLLPMDRALAGYPACTVDDDLARRIQQGQPVDVPLPAGDQVAQRLCRAYNGQGEFIAVLRYDPQTALWQPDKVFSTG